MSSCIYLACPYTHENPAIRESRFEAVTFMAGSLMQTGALVYSPITMGHSICKRCELPQDFAYWEASCISYLTSWATALYVLTLPGWQESRGVLAEIKAACATGLPIIYIKEPCHD